MGRQARERMPSETVEELLALITAEEEKIHQLSMAHKPEEAKAASQHLLELKCRLPDGHPMKPSALNKVSRTLSHTMAENAELADSHAEFAKADRACCCAE